MAKKKDNKPLREQDFETYIMWKSLPSILKGKTEAELQAAGIDDPIVTDLLSIRFQKQFAKRFKLDETTLVAWNKRIDDKGLLIEKRKQWLSGLTSNVMTAL